MGSKITKICSTSEKLSGRGGLALFLRYALKIGLYGLFSNTLSAGIVTNNKGLQLPQFLKQMFAFIMDGTDMSINGFDKKKEDTGYTALLENTTEEMASSHQIKRFFIKMQVFSNKTYNKILHALFLWRLHIENPQIIELGIDTMVLDNDSANKREGSEPTYKRKKGFQPLHICWGSFLIDVMFRRGSAHSNHGTDYTDRVKAIVFLIRKHYSKDVPILICADSGFADQKAFAVFEEELDIHYITTGKIYKSTKEYVEELPGKSYGEITKDKAIWGYVELGNKLDTWAKFRRCVFTHLRRDHKGQYVMDFGKPDNLIYTNIGMCPKADEKLLAAGGEDYFNAETIVRKSHERGADELIHRSLKELATKEQLPFKSFGMNRAYYFLLVITHFILEAYKRDITADVIPLNVYPTTFRRRMIDFAAKITSKARTIVLRVTKTVYNEINIAQLWIRCQSPPPILC